jgi:hypothetical protein
MENLDTILAGVARVFFFILILINIYLTRKHWQIYQRVKRERVSVIKKLEALHRLEKKLAEQKLKVLGLDQHLPSLN